MAHCSITASEFPQSAALRRLPMAHEVKADWRIIDPATLDAPLANAYADYKAAYAFMKEARTAFEKAMTSAASVPSHERLVFGYNFGKLSVAIVPNDKPAARPDRNALSLTNWLALKRANGDRA